MGSRSLKALSAPALAASLLMAGCASVSESSQLSDAAEISEAGTLEAGLLADASSSLAEITKLGDWISASAEYAEALAAARRHGEAVALLMSAHQASLSLEPADRLKASITINQSLASIGAHDEAAVVDAAARETAASIESKTTRQDSFAKLATSVAASGDLAKALALVSALPQDESDLASLKARAYREIAEKAAGQGKFEVAEETISRITFGLPYYRAVARSDAAFHAIKQGGTELAQRLLDDAETLARADEDGYFAAGALRDTAKGWALLGDAEKSAQLFGEAVALTEGAKSPQQTARAISRIATVMADVGMGDMAGPYLMQSIATNRTEPSDVMRKYSFYEIAGSTAFTGDFAAARGLLPEVPDETFGSAGSLRDATSRDIAWGEARHGKLEQAAKTARAIMSPRERVQALSRIVRLIRDPQMKAFARYL